MPNPILSLSLSLLAMGSRSTLCPCELYPTSIYLFNKFFNCRLQPAERYNLSIQFYQTSDFSVSYSLFFPFNLRCNIARTHADNLHQTSDARYGYFTRALLIIIIVVISIIFADFFPSIRIMATMISSWNAFDCVRSLAFVIRT